MNSNEIIMNILNDKQVGVLLLEGNHSFGRLNKKLLYKCRPSNKELPLFYIPYDINLKKHNKFIKNKYIEFYFTHKDNNKYYGLITETFGDIDDDEAFYNYELGKYGFQSYCLLSSKIKQWYGKGIFVEEYYTKYYQILLEEKKLITKNDKIRDYIISIDQKGSKDLDDAISMFKDETNNTTILSVYITCVPLVMNVIHDWTVEPKNSTSVYLPNRVLHMLPKCISENICSLSSKEAVALVGDFIVDNSFNITDFKMSIELINVKKNYYYESKELIEDEKYQSLKNFIIMMNKYQKILNNLNDSIDVVGYLMILMNKYTAKFLRDNNTGIFRWSTYKDDISQIYQHNNFNSLPNRVKNFLEIQRHNSAVYGLVSDIQPHNALHLDEYCHITSPIRRLSDLVNMILVIKILSPELLNVNAYIFAEKYLNNASIIKLTNQLKNASRISRKCLLLSTFNRERMNENEEFEYEAYIYTIEEIPNPKKNYKYDYSIYLPKFNYTFNVKSLEKYEICDKVIIKVYVFLNNDTLAKKIRISIVSKKEYVESSVRENQ